MLDDLVEEVLTQAKLAFPPLKNINPGTLGVNPGGLGVDSRVDFGEPRLHLGPQFSDLGSDGGNDVLPAQIPDFLNGGMDHPGVRFGTAQSLIEGVGGGFSGHNRTPL